MPDDGSLCPLLAGEGDVTSPETLFVRYEFGGEHTYRPSLGRIWGSCRAPSPFVHSAGIRHHAAFDMKEKLWEL